MRDSADAYLTAYNTMGYDAVGYPYGQLPEYPLTEIPMAGGFADFDSSILACMGAQERQLIGQELAASKSFEKHLAVLAKSSNPCAAIGNDALKAISNEFDPKSFPETAGYWNVLRGTIRDVVGNLHSMLMDSAKGLTPSQRQSLIDSIMSGDFSVIGLGDSVAPPAAPGGDFLTNLIGTLGTSLTTIYGTKLQADAQQDIARINAQTAQSNAAAAQAQAQLQQQALAAQQMASGSVGMNASVGGIPVWALAAGGIGLVGLILLMALKK
ncbi:MAG: hypothetical protein U0236_21315 [Nitrospira sp.]